MKEFHWRIVLPSSLLLLRHISSSSSLSPPANIQHGAQSDDNRKCGYYPYIPDFQTEAQNLSFLKFIQRSAWQSQGSKSGRLNSASRGLANLKHCFLPGVQNRKVCTLTIEAPSQQERFPRHWESGNYISFNCPMI